MTYPRLSLEHFGQQAITSGDLDPVYIALNLMDWTVKQRDRWLLAYWLCYHPGAASWLSEQEGANYWLWLWRAAYNKPERWPAPPGGRWPRAAERRHWRGKFAVDTVEALDKEYGASISMSMVQFVSTPTQSPLLYSQVKARVMAHYGFGPWIAYKVGDMLERCCGVNVCFTEQDAMYEAPSKAAVRYWIESLSLPPTAVPRDKDAAIRKVVQHVLATFADHAAPGGGRLFGLQEAETVLCKWQSHMNGHYPVNHDLIEIRAGAEPWAVHSETAARFLQRLPVISQPCSLAGGPVAALTY